MVILFPSAGVPFERWALDANVFAVVTLSAALVEIATKLIRDVFSLKLKEKKNQLKNQLEWVKRLMFSILLKPNELILFCVWVIHVLIARKQLAAGNNMP